MRHLITVAALLAAFIAPSVASAFHNGEQVIDADVVPALVRWLSRDDCPQTQAGATVVLGILPFIEKSFKNREEPVSILS